MNATRPPEVSSPGSLDELVKIVRDTPRLIATGGLTKPRLSEVDAARVSMRHLSGIVEYEPEEFTFTARAGTPLREIVETLAAKGQHLPFDPMFVDAGATLGGTLASGVNGPGRLRFGGLRDFVLGVRFIDGTGRLLRLGGKVVKNAAGFDVPKLMVGSLGRLGVIVEATFKVFPSPAASLTLELHIPDTPTAVRLLQEIPASRWEPRAVDYDPESGYAHVRLGGPETALRRIAADILARWPGRVLAEEEAAEAWRNLRECTWAHPDGSLIKVISEAGTIPRLDELRRAAPGTHVRTSAAGDVSMISLPLDADAHAFGETLRRLDLAALTLRGPRPLRPGFRTTASIADAVKRVFDPPGRFPGLDE